jgi:RND family efflux transporter MFP subunit
MKRLSKNRFLLAVIMIVLAAGIWQGFRITKAGAAGAAPKPPKTYTVRRGTLKETLTISGEIDAQEKATLRFQSSGLLAWVGVKTGDRVTKYQAIASLDKQDLTKRLQKYLLTYRKTRLDFDQTKDEYQQPPYWGLSETARNKIDKTFDKAQSDLTASVLDVELQNLTLQFATLTTPIAGIVTRVDSPTAGVNITPATAEFDIVDPSTLYLSVLADQTEVVKMHASMSADVTLDPFHDQKVTGSVSAISYTPKAGESGTVYEVKIRLPSADGIADRLRLGMTGDATFTMGEKHDVLSVPLSSVKPEGDKRYVTRRTGGNGRQKQYVTTGLETDTDAEITSGLADGDVIYD